MRGVEIVFGIKDGLKKTFRIEEKIHYHSESLDIAILKLLPNEYQDFPPPLRNFRYLDPVTDEDLALYLVGYPDASKNEQTVNLEVALWNPSDKRMRDLQEFCKREGFDCDGYLGLNNSERLVVKCDFEHGASGCPGLLIDNGQVNVVTTFLRGYPAFYYSQWFKRDHREKYDFFPKDKMYQQGVKISALRDALKSSKFYHHILKDIFDTEQTLEPNTHVLTVSGH